VGRVVVRAQEARLRTSRLWLCSLLFACGGEGPQPVVPIDLARVSLPVRCRASAPPAGLHALGGETIALGYRPTAEVSMANVLLLSRDEGRTFTRPVGRAAPPLATPWRSTALASSGAFAVDDTTWISVDGLTGVSRLPGPEDDFTDLDWLLVARGEQLEDHLATASPGALPSGEARGRMWSVAPDLTLAQVGLWLWASKDGGGTWRVVGWRPFSLEYAGFSRLDTRAARLDLAVVEDPLTGRYYAVRPGEAPQALSVTNASGARERALRVGLFGDGVAFVARPVTATGAPIPGAPLQLVVAGLDGAERGRWDWPTDLTGTMRFVEGADGTLWVLPEVTEGAEVPSLVRLSPGAAAPERVVLDLEAAGFDGVTAALARPDGRVLFGARVLPERARRGTRYLPTAMLCEVGPGVTQGVETLAIEPLSAAVEAPGAVVRVARIGDGTTTGERFRVTPSGLVLATQLGELRAEIDVAPLYDARLGAPASDGLPSTEAYDPGALLGVSDEAVTVPLRLRSNLTVDPPRTQLLTLDPYSGGAQGRAALPFGNEQIYDEQVAFGQAFLTTERGSYARLDLEGPVEARRELPRGMIIEAGFGVVFDDGYVPDRGVRAQERPVYVVRFDPLRGRIPDPFACRDTPTLAGCLALPDADVVAARIAPGGDLYALDWRHGRVVRLPAGADAFETVAEGFLSPSDLRVAVVQGTTVVLVYDGDVFAFAPRAGQVARRGARPGPSSAVAAANGGPRDGRGCLAGGPCLEPLAPGASCATGRGLGAAGRLVLGGREVPTTRWSDGEVCFAPEALGPQSGLLRAVRADGAESGPIRWRAPRALGAWTIPSVVTPETVVRVAGTNLQAGAGITVSGALLRAAGDDELELLVPESAQVTVSIDGEVAGGQYVAVRPVIAQTCAAGPGEACELVVLGLGPIRGEVRIADQVAELVRWAPPLVSVRWPPGLAPGTHAVEVEGLDGGPAQGTVTLQAEGVTALIEGANLTRTLEYRHARPVLTPFGPLLGANEVTRTVQAALLVGVSAEGGGWARRRVGLDIPAANTLQVVRFDAQTLVLGNTARGLGVYRLEEAGGAVSAALVGYATGLEGLLAGAGVIDGTLVVAVRDVALPETRVVTLDLAGVSGESVPATVLDYTPGRFGLDAAEQVVSHGAWVGPDGLYVGECHNLDKPAELYFVPVVRRDGALVVEGREVLVQAPDARILACAPTATGFAWVQREADGQERLRTWSPATLGRPTEVVTLPATLGGVGQTTGDGLPGVLDLAELEGGDWLLLLADREGEDHGLSVVRYVAASGAFRASAPFGTSTAVEPGELCVGPLSEARCEAGLGNAGCAPFACPVRPAARLERPDTHPQDAYLLRGEGDLVHVFYEVSNTRRTPGFVDGGVELQHRALALP
jgi:hypothetical protein